MVKQTSKTDYNLYYSYYKNSSEKWGREELETEERTSTLQESERIKIHLKNVKHTELSRANNNPPHFSIKKALYQR